MKPKNYSLYFFIILFLIILFLFYLILKPFILTIILAIIITATTYPVYKKLNSKIKNKNLSSLLMCVLIILIIFIPSTLILGAVVNEAKNLSVTVKKNIDKLSKLPEQCEQDINNINCKIVSYIKKSINQIDYKKDIEPRLQQIVSYVVTQSSRILIGITNTIISVVILFLTMFYLFKDGDKLLIRINELIPLKKSHKNQIIKRFLDVNKATIFGGVIVALIQGALGGIGFIIFGIKNPFLWGSLMALFALIPLIGTGIIWLPASIILLITGQTFNGIGLLLYGIFVISLTDNFIRPILIGSKTKINSLLIFFSVFGGLKLFGLIGIFLGPIIIAFLLTFIDIYKLEFKSLSKD